MSDLSELYLLLCIEEKLRVQAGFPNLKKEVRNALLAYDEHGLNAHELPTPIFPADSGVDEDGTEHITPESDRGEHE